MSAAVRWATPPDAEDLALILREMAVHYRQPPLSGGDSGLRRRSAGSRTKARPTRISRSPIVKGPSPALPRSRSPIRASTSSACCSSRICSCGTGIARPASAAALLQFLADQCLEKGIGRIDLTTEDWNEGAIRFYEKLGAKRHDQKIFLRFDTGRT